MTKEDIAEKVMLLSEASKDRILIAVDGRCCAGKTTFAGYLSEKTGCNVFHMDDFFLRPEQRTEARLNEPGGNVDRERFEAEVMTAILKNDDIEYRRFDCRTMSLQPPVIVRKKKINIIEGAYCCHPDLFDKYDLRIFIDISKEDQKERILKRNGRQQWEIFRNRWIPMEEKYFEAFGIREKSDIIMIM